MAEILSGYLTRMAGRPFVYGTDDCATFVLGWLDIAHGRNALAAWRGMYVDEASCEAFIAANGGFAAIASAFFVEHYGLAPSAPAAGQPVYATFKGISAMGLRVDNDRMALRTRAGVLITARATVSHEWGPA